MPHRDPLHGLLRIETDMRKIPHVPPIIKRLRLRIKARHQLKRASRLQHSLKLFEFEARAMEMFRGFATEDEIILLSQEFRLIIE